MFNKRINLFLICTVFMFLISHIVYAQEIMTLAQGPKRELLMFEEIPMVVSASKHEQPLIKAPAAISVITSEDIENMDYVHLWDLFRRVPGVDVATIDGRAGSVAPRGFLERFTRRNQLLIDGRSAYSPLYGGTEWSYLPLLPENIERIEVIRGPNSTLYGSNAFTGVINIITKKPEDTKGVFLKESIGTHDYQRSMMRYGGSAGKLDYRASYTYSFDRGYGSDNGKDMNDKARDHTFDWRSKYNFNDNSNLEFFLGDREDRGRSVAVNAVSTNSQDNVRYNFQQLKYNTKVFGDQDIYFQLFRTEISENRHGSAIYLYPIKDSETRQYDFEMQHAFNWWKDAINTVWGANTRYNTGAMYLMDGTYNNSRPVTGKSVGDHIYRAFFNNDWKITDKWNFIFGVMMENNRFVETSWSPRYTVMFAPTPNRSFRFSYARAFRTPTMLEDIQNFTVSGPVPTVRTIGNADMKKEVVDAYELGYNTYLLENRLNLGLQTFYNKYEDLQDTFSSGFPTTISTFDNGNKAQARGIEFNADYTPKDWVKLYSNFTFQKITDTKAKFKDAEPKFKANFGSRFLLDKPGLTINLDGYYVDTYKSFDLENTADTGLKVEPYLRFDFRVAKTFFNGNLKWAIKGENMFDQSHIEARTGSSTQIAVEIERAIYTTLTAKF